MFVILRSFNKRLHAYATFHLSSSLKNYRETSCDLTNMPFDTITLYQFISIILKFSEFIDFAL